MEKRKPYVMIQSNITIQVTAGLQNEDVTNPDAHVADRLKISPSWPRATVLIVEGQHIYPSEIIDWNTVQNLQKDKVLTIGAFVDTADEKTTALKAELHQTLVELNVIKEDEEAEKVKDIVEETTKTEEVITTKAKRLADIV